MKTGLIDVDGQLSMDDYMNELKDDPDYIEPCECGGTPIVTSVKAGIGKEESPKWLYKVECTECGMISCKEGRWISNRSKAHEAIKDWNKGKRAMFGEPNKMSDWWKEFIMKRNPYYCDKRLNDEMP